MIGPEAFEPELKNQIFSDMSFLYKMRDIIFSDFIFKTPQISFQTCAGFYEADSTH